MPCRAFSEFEIVDLEGRELVTVGCVNFEERCTAVPRAVRRSYGTASNMFLFEFDDPPGGIPDYTQERRAKVRRHKSVLEEAGVEWTPIFDETLASEDSLLRDLAVLTRSSPKTVILDISALPKRVFCFLLRRLLGMSGVRNVVITYTEAGDEGYTSGHLTADVMSPETLPGFAGRLTEAESNLVASVGFEALGLRALILSLYREDNANFRVILPFPAPLTTVRRQWNTLREIMEDDPGNIRRDSVSAIAAWDAEQVYHKLAAWASNGERLSLAPYGPKPHTLGMALFAIKHEAGIWYTQPKVYHPDYSLGTGVSRWYIVKWDGVKCFDRT